MSDLFTPTEQAFLCDYFGMVRSPELADIDVRQATAGQGIYVEECVNAVFDKVPLHNAVARFALGVIQNRLPQCGVINGGKLTLTRKPFYRPHRDVVLLPQHLFMINWADSAPGISWPETYHITYIPDYDRYVVTASVDSPDLYGATEMAIGHFDGDSAPAEGSASVIKAWWHYLQENCQDRWAYVWDEGLIDRATARGWADEVWVEGSAENDEED